MHKEDIVKGRNDGRGHYNGTAGAGGHYKREG